MQKTRTTIDYGIDLGTTNSVIARQVGAQTEILDGVGGALLPSVVAIGASDEVLVGRPAIERRAFDPANVSSEFKRLMGTTETILFPAAGKRLSPVQLSAEVLKTLVRRAESAGANVGGAAVITIPAMFTLPQCEATREAAKVAGLRYAPLLQEPIAAAIASIGSADLRDGYWLVYDFGGGTFDVSLVRSRSGRLQVLDHDGDNHMGGKDFDRLVTRMAAQKVREAGLIPNFNRGVQEFEGAFERLRTEAERVRILLSEKTSAVFSVDNLVGKDGISFELDRRTLEELIRPSLSRTIEVCRTILERNDLFPSDLKRIVLVGGPTLTPCLPFILEHELGVDSRHYVDPVCAVAIGAAIYASTQRIPAEYREKSSSSETLSLELFYESMTIEARPVVAGQFEGELPPGEWAVSIVSADGTFDSGLLRVNADGKFAGRVNVQANTLNSYCVSVRRDGTKFPDLSSSFSIIHGTTIAKPVLSQSVGAALADNSVRWYLRKGVVLPAQQRSSHSTTIGLRQGHPGTPIKIPLVQGESDFGDRNTVIGLIEIKADELDRDLPVGSEVIVTLSLDEHSTTRAEAYLPMLNRTFSQIAKFGLETRSAEHIRDDMDSQRARLAELEKMAAELEGSSVKSVDSRVQAIEELLTEGGADERNQADQLLKNLVGVIDTWTVRDEEQQLREKFVNSDRQIRNMLEPNGSPRIQQYTVLSSEFHAALTRGDMRVAETRYKAVESLEWELLQEQPSYWVSLYEHLCNFFAQNPQAEAQPAIEQGKTALQKNDLPGLRRACVTLVRLMPERGQQQLPSVLISQSTIA